jgi:hypothetical protein
VWIKNKRTGEYKNLSPAVAKHTISNDNSWKDTQSKYCSCGAENHREKTHCKFCGKLLE